MKAPNEFWLHLHRLAEAYEAEGLTTHERAENILGQFHEMPPIARRQVMADLLNVVVHLPDLYPLVTAAVHESDSPLPHMET